MGKDTKKVPIGGQTIRAWKLKRDKRKDLSEAKKVYQQHKGLWRKIRELLFGLDKAPPSKDPASATMIGQQVLKNKGYSTLHANDMMKEIKGIAPDHITDKMVIQTVSRVEGEMIKPNEVALLLKNRIPNFEHGMVIRYQGRDYMPMRVKRLDQGTLYHLKRCRG